MIQRNKAKGLQIALAQTDNTTKLTAWASSYTSLISKTFAISQKKNIYNYDKVEQHHELASLSTQEVFLPYPSGLPTNQLVLFISIQYPLRSVHVLY